MWISKVSTHSFWFSWFMTGIHKQVGEIKRQDKPVTINVLHELNKILEIEWRQTKDPLLRTMTAEMGTWNIGGFCTRLRGEEMLLIEYAGTAKILEHLLDVVDPHFTF